MRFLRDFASASRVFHSSRRTQSSRLCVQDEFCFPLSTRSRLDVPLSVDDHLANTNTVSATRLTSCQTLATRSFICFCFRLTFTKILILSSIFRKEFTRNSNLREYLNLPFITNHRLNNEYYEFTENFRRKTNLLFRR